MCDRIFMPVNFLFTLQNLIMIFSLLMYCAGNHTLLVCHLSATINLPDVHHWGIRIGSSFRNTYNWIYILCLFSENEDLYIYWVFQQFISALRVILLYGRFMWEAVYVLCCFALCHQKHWYNFYLLRSLQAVGYYWRRIMKIKRVPSKF